LKELFRKFKTNKHFRIVSVSLDRNKTDWIKAVNQENMEWEQLWITEALSPYQNEIFHFDGLIPTTIFTDYTGNILSKFTGYDPTKPEIYTDSLNALLAQ